MPPPLTICRRKLNFQVGKPVRGSAYALDDQMTQYSAKTDRARCNHNMFTNRPKATNLRSHVECALSHGTVVVTCRLSIAPAIRRNVIAKNGRPSRRYLRSKFDPTTSSAPAEFGGLNSQRLKRCACRAA